MEEKITEKININDVIIRKENPDDYLEIEILVREAFWNKYQPGCDEHYLVNQIRTQKNYLKNLSRIAVYNKKIVGCIYYSNCELEINKNKKIKFLTFGPIGVLPEYQKQGIGKLLITTTLNLCKCNNDYIGICIFGSPNYYSKFGFKNAKEYNICTEDGKNFDSFMCYELVPNSIKKSKELSNGKMKFILPKDIYYDFPKEKLEEYDKKFAPKVKLVLPGQLHH